MKFKKPLFEDVCQENNVHEIWTITGVLNSEMLILERVSCVQAYSSIGSNLRELLH